MTVPDTFLGKDLVGLEPLTAAQITASFIATPFAASVRLQAAPVTVVFPKALPPNSGL